MLTPGLLKDDWRDNIFAVDVNDVKAAISTKSKVIVPVNPNSPTETITPRSDIV